MIKNNDAKIEQNSKFNFFLKTKNTRLFVSISFAYCFYEFQNVKCNMFQVNFRLLHINCRLKCQQKRDPKHILKKQQNITKKKKRKTKIAILFNFYLKKKYEGMLLEN